MNFASSAAYLITFLSAANNVRSEKEHAVYGVDVSYPMHHRNVSKNFDWHPWNNDPSIEVPDEYEGMVVQPLGDRQKVYDDLISGCVEHYGERGLRCVDSEKDRVEMSLRQPKGMHNYTKLGYTKIRAPEHVFKLINDFWKANKGKEKTEDWHVGNTYVNHWESPSYMVSVQDETLEGGGYVLQQHIWNAARDTISEWTGQQLAECSLYGIRIYKENAVLATHVDRLPLVSSAIINVDQDVDEPWPLEVIGHDGIAVNVTMEPGDLVLYESHSVLHGRPFPLKGRFMANVFIHFEPIGPVGEQIDVDEDLPGYIIRGSEEEKNWRRQNPKGYSLRQTSFTTGTTPVHKAATVGDSQSIKTLLKDKAHLVNARDINGWMPLHEAARAGNFETVQTLLDYGADLNARTKGDDGRGAAGGTPLWWALKYHPEDHKMVQLLKDRGAKKIGPGEKSEL